MDLKWLSGFDAYSYRARLLPALLTLLPAFLTTMILFPALYSQTGAAIASLAVWCGVLWFLANVARTRGRQVEKRLTAKWGGLPTTCMLRHRDETIDQYTKDRYHEFLRSKIPALHLPSREEERLDPANADAAYRSGVKWLLEFTRDKQRYSLLFSENVAYGFRRNLYGAKFVGILITLLALALTALVVAQTHPTQIASVSGPHILLAVLLLFALACWLALVTEASVRDASTAYARALLAACDTAPAPEAPFPR